jgi:hypothetical protein
MRTKLAAAIALAGSLLMASFFGESAQATSAPSLSNANGNGMLTLVAQKSGGWGGGGGHGGGGFAARAGHGGGSWGGGRHPGTMVQGGGVGRGFAGPKTGGPRFAEGPRGGHFALRDRGRFVERGERFEHRRFAERGHDFDHFHHRHRAFVNGVWIWTYGPDYYAYGDDCWWLHRQALITGSPYWWSRYNRCVGYD